MIEKVQLKYFKQFKGESFDLGNSVVLAGPNNAGKTTLLQAIATWHFAFREWQKKRGMSTAKKRSSVALTRKQFLSVPVQRFNLLWTGASTALQKDEGGGKGAATPRIMEITLKGRSETNVPWEHTMEFRYANSELIYAKPADPMTVPSEEIKVVYVPSFSGIETEEKVHTPEYQEWLVGQGKPGDIIRNLLAETSDIPSEWKKLQEDVEKIFGYHLLKPQHKGFPFILCEYLPGIPPKRGYGGLPKLDIASAGSGFLQTLLLLSFFYARPSTVLLIDEPDAHLHVILQKQIYDHLGKVAKERKCQVVVATHSEVVIDNTSPGKIISFYDRPHMLVNKTERAEVQEALKYLTSMNILQADRGKILYGEDDSDFNILRAWVSILNHNLKEWFSDPFYFPIKGNNPKSAKNHFFALRAVNQKMSGVLVLDSDNRNVPDHDVSAEGLKIIRWNRYEIENYLLHHAPIERFIEKEMGPICSKIAVDKMRDEWPPALLKSPLKDIDFVQSTAASKRILPGIFSATGMNIQKRDYYKLAEEMQKNEIPPEVEEKLNEIYAHWGS